MLLSDGTHTPKNKRATSHSTCRLHYSAPYEVESGTLILGYWPLPGKSRVVTDRLRKATHAKDCVGRVGVWRADIRLRWLFHSFRCGPTTVLPVVSHRFVKFDPEAAFHLIDDFGVRNAFLPPTALKMMRSVPNPRARWRLDMRSIASGGESLGRELLDWGRRTFGLRHTSLSGVIAVIDERYSVVTRSSGS
jgi:hypothetical protein